MFESKWVGLLGVVAISAAAYGLSNNRKKINYRLVGSGLVLQLVMAVFVLKVEFGQHLFRTIGDGITSLLSCSDAGAAFVRVPAGRRGAQGGVDVDVGSSAGVWLRDPGRQRRE